MSQRNKETRSQSFKIFMFLIMSILMLSVVSAIDWNTNNSLNTEIASGSFTHPTLFEFYGKDVLYHAYSTFVKSYEFNGTTFIENSSLLTGIPNTRRSKGSVFLMNETYNFIFGDTYGLFYAYTWTGTSWVENSTLTNGLDDIGDESAPTVFYYDDELYLIAGEYTFNTWNGYKWNGTSWESYPNIKTGLGSLGRFLTFDTEIYNETLIGVAGAENGLTYGYYYNGSSWILDNSLVNNTIDVGSRSSSSIYKTVNNDYFLFTGEQDTSNLNVYSFTPPIIIPQCNTEINDSCLFSGYFNYSTEYIDVYFDYMNDVLINETDISSNQTSVTIANTLIDKPFRIVFKNIELNNPYITQDNNICSIDCYNYEYSNNNLSINSYYGGVFSYQDQYSSSLEYFDIFRNDSIATPIGDVGGFSKPYMFEFEGETYLFVGEGSSVINSYRWNGATWIGDSYPKTGLTNRAWFMPTIWKEKGTYYLLAGYNGVGIDGYEWTGTTWVVNSDITNGITLYNKLSPEIVVINGTKHLIVGAEIAGNLKGYTWNGNSWISNSTMINGISTTSTSNVRFDILSINQNNHYALMGYNPRGYKWNNDLSTWQSDDFFSKNIENFNAYNYFSIKDMSDRYFILAGENFGTLLGYQKYFVEETPFVQYLDSPCNQSFVLHSNNQEMFFNWTDIIYHATPYLTNIQLEKGVLIKEVITLNSSFNNYTYDINSSGFVSGVYDVVLNVSDTNGLSFVDTCQIDICINNWQEQYSQCENYERTLTYIDVNNCSIQYDIPIDNNTIHGCDSDEVTGGLTITSDPDKTLVTFILVFLGALIILWFITKNIVVGGLTLVASIMGTLGIYDLYPNGSLLIIMLMLNLVILIITIFSYRKE